MGIQGRMLRFIGELIGERQIKVKVRVSISQSKQTDLKIPQGGVLSVKQLQAIRAQKEQNKDWTYQTNPRTSDVKK